MGPHYHYKYSSHCSIFSPSFPSFYGMVRSGDGRERVRKEPKMIKEEGSL